MPDRDPMELDRRGDTSTVEKVVLTHEHVEDIWAKIERWSKRWKMVVGACVTIVVTIVSTVAWTASYLGAQHSGPGQRIASVELKVDSGLQAITERVVRLETFAVDSVKKWLTDRDERDDLTLRISCRQIQFADLIRACDRAGVRR